MKWRVLLFAVFVVATAVAAERWWSPDKFYSIVPPADWKHSESKTVAGFSYAFTSADGQSEVRVSATYHLNLPGGLPEDATGGNSGLRLKPSRFARWSSDRRTRLVPVGALLVRVGNLQNARFIERFA
jgi:hypothetical protein